MNVGLKRLVLDLLGKSTLAQMGKFGIVGATGMVINLGILWVLTELFSIYYMYSAVVAILVAGFWNFIWNKYWTFGKFNAERTEGSKEEPMAHKQLARDLLGKSTLTQMGKFGIVGATGMVINLGILWVLTELFSIYYMYSAVIAILLAGFWNFIWNKYWTFGKFNAERTEGSKEEPSDVFR